MKLAVAVCGLALLLLAAGCAGEPSYGYSGYGGSVYGEYPGVPYNYSYPYPYSYRYYRYAPYDRDHYWDRGHYWDRHRYPYGSRDYYWH